MIATDILFIIHCRYFTNDIRFRPGFLVSVIPEGETLTEIRLLSDDLIGDRIVATAGSDVNLTCAIDRKFTLDYHIATGKKSQQNTFNYIFLHWIICSQAFMNKTPRIIKIQSTVYS